MVKYMEKIKQKVLGLEIVRDVLKIPYLKQVIKTSVKLLLPKSVANEVVEFISRTPYLKKTVKTWVDNLPNQSETLPKVMKFLTADCHISPKPIMMLLV